MKLSKGMDIYQWIPGTKTGTKIHNSIVEDLMNDPNFNAEEFGKRTMDQLGFEKIGTESIIGKPCEIYSGMGTKIWIWNGIALKTDVKVLGQKTTWTATSVKVNENVPSSKFEVPSDIKFEDMGNLDPVEMMNKSMEQQDEEANNQTDSVKSKSEEDVPVKSLKDLKGFLKKIKTE